uniref:Nuclear receptor n=1 Tax=Rhabditophanes sp. KR3021 TaxID=114890 RepID=A0AC35TQI0_9BILA
MNIIDSPYILSLDHEAYLPNEEYYHSMKDDYTTKYDDSTPPPPRQHKIKGGRSSKSFKNCGICGGVAKGFHFNSRGKVCDSCTAYFRRAVVHKRSFKCRFNENCQINTATRNSCRSCRMRACLAFGMNPNAVQPHHDPIGPVGPRQNTTYNSRPYQDQTPQQEYEYQQVYVQEASLSPCYSLQNQPSSSEISTPDKSRFFENAITYYKRKTEQRRLINCYGNFRKCFTDEPPEFRKIKYGEHIQPQCFRVDIGTFIMFLSDIKAFEGFSDEDRTLLLRNICIFSHFVEKHYLSMKYGGLAKQHLIYPDFTYVDLSDLDKVEIWSRTGKNIENQEEKELLSTATGPDEPNFDNVKRALLYAVKNSYNIITKAMIEYEMTDAEYIALLLIMLYNTDLPGISKDAIKLCQEKRNMVFKEWMEYYHRIGEPNSIAKIGNITLLLSVIKDSCAEVASGFHMIRVFKIFDYDKLLEELYL